MVSSVHCKKNVKEENNTRKTTELSVVNYKIACYA